jgi:DNA-directed RNA polymerase specialized sigma24 family protein
VNSVEPDLDLMLRLQHDDPSAWEAFDRTWRPWLEIRVRRVARVRNWFWVTDHDDLVQEAMILFGQRVREGRFRFQSDPQLKAYLLKAAFFVAMRWKRAARLQTRPLEATENHPAPRDLPAIDWVAAAWEASDRYRCLEMLVATLAELGAQRRQVLELTLLGLKPWMIAERMGKTPGAISCLKFHALADLKRALDRTKFVEECADTLQLDLGGDAA